MPTAFSIILLIVSSLALLFNVYTLGHTKGYCDGIQHCIDTLEENRRKLMAERSDSYDTNN